MSLWSIGFLFTAGLFFSGFKGRAIDKLVLFSLLVVGWPIMLGIVVNELYEENKKGKDLNQKEETTI